MDFLLVVFLSTVEQFGQITSIFSGLEQQPLANRFKFKSHALKRIWLFWHCNRSSQQWSSRHTAEPHFSHDIVHRVQFIFVNIFISATPFRITLIPLSHPSNTQNQTDGPPWHRHAAPAAVRVCRQEVMNNQPPASHCFILIARCSNYIFTSCWAQKKQTKKKKMQEDNKRNVLTVVSVPKDFVFAELEHILQQRWISDWFSWIKIILKTRNNNNNHKKECHSSGKSDLHTS